MSLDVYLTLKGVQNLPSGEHIFIREDGANKEITREEWKRRFPDREPIVIEFPSDNEEVYSANITHNLNRMAGAAGIYEALWQPQKNGIVKANQLIEPLAKGLALLLEKPEYFNQFNPVNGWGSYEGLVSFVANYIEACKQYPEAEVRASR